MEINQHGDGPFVFRSVLIAFRHQLNTTCSAFASECNKRCADSICCHVLTSLAWLTTLFILLLANSQNETSSPQTSSLIKVSVDKTGLLFQQTDERKLKKVRKSKVCGTRRGGTGVTKIETSGCQKVNERFESGSKKNDCACWWMHAPLVQWSTVMTSERWGQASI